MEKMKELDLKLIASNEELKEYKTLTKSNYECFKDYQYYHFANCQCSREMKELKTWLKEKDEELIKTMKKMEQMRKLELKFIATNKEVKE